MILAICVAVAVAVRAYDITGYPLDFQPIKQYRSATMARLDYFEALGSVPEQQMQIARANVEAIGSLGAPIVETVAAQLFIATGGERIWLARMLSVLYWIIGAIFLYLLACTLGSSDGAIIAVGVYLFVPFGIAASRSFQPDPAMVGTMVVGLYLLVRHDEVHSRGRLLSAAFVASLSILIKPVAGFFLLAAFASLAVYRDGVRASIRKPLNWVFGLISVAPSVLLYGYDIVSGGPLRHQAEVSFLPALLLEGHFWRAWLNQVYQVIGFVMLVTAILGAMHYQARARALAIGLWVAYLAYGVVFTFHIHTHDYYQLPLIPIAALSLAPIGTLALKPFSRRTSGPLARLAAAGVLVLAIALSCGVYLRQHHQLPADFAADVQLAEDLGKLVGHSKRVVMLAEYNGRPLRYHGNFSGFSWPRVVDIQRQSGREQPSAEELFRELDERAAPEYFVVTDFREYASQPDLMEFLVANFRIVRETKQYVVFDLRSPTRQASTEGK